MSIYPGLQQPVIEILEKIRVSDLQRKDTHIIALEPQSYLCFLVVRNEMLRLPFILKYYREKGITDFFIVDNDSQDNTLAYLLLQPDVYVWHTSQHFSKKLDWLSCLLQIYALGHWSLIIDADEILYYPDCEEQSIPQLCNHLDKQGKNALQVIMLDLYSDKSIKATNYQQGEDFLASCSFFDRQFFHHREGISHDYYWGGLRQRVFGTSNQQEKKLYCLTKFPLLKYNSIMQLYSSHLVKNIKISSTTGCLLHFKYFSSFIDYVQEEIKREQHWQGASEYKKYANIIGEQENFTLYDSVESIKLKSSQQLIDLGIIKRGFSTENMPRFLVVCLELGFDLIKKMTNLVYHKLLKKSFPKLVFH